MTIKINHSKAPVYAPPEATYTGLQPSVVTADGARSTFENLMNWRQWGQLANYYGRPDNTLNAEYDGTFHIISPVTHPQNAGQQFRKIGFDCHCWDYTDAGSVTEFYYNSVAIPGISSITRPASRTQGYDEVPDGISIQSIQTVDQSTQTDGYASNTFRVDGSLVARLGVYSLPEYDLNTDQAYRLNGGNFGSGQPLKGDLNNSIGTLAQFQNSTSTDIAESIVSNTRRCLSQWITPAGIYCLGAGAGLAWSNFWGGFTFKVRPRNLRGLTYASGSNIVPIDIAMVARADQDTEIRFTSSVTSDVYTHTFSALLSSETLTVDLQSLDIAPEGDEILVEVNTSTTQAVEVHSIAFFEPQNGIEI
jgi:hypothetical protein